MGNCSNNCNPCQTSCDNIDQLANKAANYARQAATSAVNAGNAFSNLTTIYLGAKDAAPTVDNEGNPLIIGALYFSTVTDIMYSWDGTAWISAIAGANTATTDTNQTITGVKTFSQPIIGDLTGNATTATTLEASRTFNLSGDVTGVAQSFNGSANVVIPSIISSDAITTAKIQNNSVTAAKLGANEQKQICKAWVNFDGNTSPGTIRSSYNVSSVTKNATGDYTINFTIPLTDANYSTSILAQGANIGNLHCSIAYAGTITGGAQFVAPSTASIRFTTWLSDLSNQADSAIVCVSIFGT